MNHNQYAQDIRKACPEILKTENADEQIHWLAELLAQTELKFGSVVYELETNFNQISMVRLEIPVIIPKMSTELIHRAIKMKDLQAFVSREAITFLETQQDDEESTWTLRDLEEIAVNPNKQMLVDEIIDTLRRNDITIII